MAYETAAERDAREVREQRAADKAKAERATQNAATTPNAPELTADQNKAIALRKQISDADGKTGELRTELAELEAKIAATPPVVKSVEELKKESDEAAEAERLRDIENARAREQRKQEALTGRGTL